MKHVLVRDYERADRAQECRRRLVGAGMPADEVQVIEPTLRAQQVAGDENMEREGSFADSDPVYHDRNVERQGSFADSEPVYHDRNVEREGSFGDSEPAYHDRNVEPKGSFAEEDTAARAAAQPWDDALRRAGIVPSEFDRYRAYLRQGHTLVVVQARDDNAAQVAALLAECN